MYKVTMDLIGDWTKTVKEIVQSAGGTLAGESTSEDIALRYFLLTKPEEQAHRAAEAELTRLREMEQTISDHLESMIVPDIRKRTNYNGDEFHFCWVYNQGEHIVELNSEYRIPL